MFVDYFVGLSLAEVEMVKGLIKKFGGMSAMARSLGHRYPTTVQGWSDAGTIPLWRRETVLSVANKQGIPLSSKERECLSQGNENTDDSSSASTALNMGLAVEKGWALHLLDNASDMVCLCQNGVISYVNGAGIQLLGLKSAKKIIGRHFNDFVHGDYRDAASELLKRQGVEVKTLPMKMLSNRGVNIDTELSFLPFADGGNGTVIIQVRDITDRLRSAEAILRSEIRYRNLTEQSFDMVCICEHGKITFINSAGMRILGANEQSQLIGCRLAKLVHADYRGVISDGLQSLCDEGAAVPLKFIRLDKRIIDVEVAVVNFGSLPESSFMMEVRDITERKRADEKLRKAHYELEQRVEERTKELTEEITERRHAEAKLSLAAKVITNLKEAVVIVDNDFKVTSINPAFTVITGFSLAEVSGKEPAFYKTVKSNPQLKKKMKQALKRNGSWKEEFWCKNKNGNDYALRLSISAIIDETGKVYRYAVVMNDITKRKQDEEHIHHQANYDTLTDLPNRSLFHDRLNQALPAMGRTNRKLGLMFIDLDGFKLINDTLGHNCGDLLLQETSRRLSMCIRSGDTVARLGGDEFTIIMPNLHKPENAPLLAQRILDSLTEPFILGDKEASVSCSIGITVFPDDASEATELIKNADAAMYSAKKKGKANFQFFTAELNEGVQERLLLKTGLSKALARDEFILHYQPKLDIKSGLVLTVEALMRWQNDEMGMVSPVRFIPIIEETGHVVEVGAWALRTACEQHKRWIEEGLPPIRIAVNLSARQLREDNFVDMFEQILKETGVGHEGLEVEITESMLMSDSDTSIRFLGKLHDMGIHIAMDDFGTGYSSLSYLKRFPIDTIKIDRSFVSDITTSSDDAEILKTIIIMGQTLNHNIVAEGVETEDQLDLLRKYDCNQIQGYFFSRPLPPENMKPFFDEKGLTGR